MGPRGEVSIGRYVDVVTESGVIEDIEAVFFEAAGDRAFESPQARETFRERWLTRYLTHFPQDAFVARERSGKTIGYLAGCLEDPARHPLFADISYFADFATLTVEFPAHLHINLAAGYRGAGIGRRLIEAFADHAAAGGVPGLHAVTADGVRNNGFYRDCGFERAATAHWNGKLIAFFARRLSKSVSVG